MTNRTVLAHEFRSILHDRWQVGLLLLFALLSIYAVFQGSRYREALRETATAFETEHLANAAAWREQMVAIETGETRPEDDPWAGLAMNVAMPAVLFPGPLADFSQGVTDVHPFTARVALWRSVDRLFGNYQFQSPGETRAGPVDPGYVIVFLMPLLMIALSFGALAGDRDSGRLGLVLSYPISVREFLASKLVVRLGAVLLIAAASLIVGLFLGAGGLPDGQRLGRFALWSLAAVGYFAFWAGAIGWIVSLNRRGETTAMTMVGLWVLISLVSPAILAAAAQLTYPARSQLAFLSLARQVSSEAHREQSSVMEGMLLEHPELSVDNYTLPEYIRESYLVTQTVDRRVEPVLEEFDLVQAQRRAFLGLVQYAAPAALALRAMNEIAGTDLERQVRFEREVRDYKSRIARAVEANVLAGERMSVAEMSRIPQWSFPEPGLGATARAVLAPVGALFLFGFGFAGRAAGRLARLETRLRETS